MIAFHILCLLFIAETFTHRVITATSTDKVSDTVDVHNQRLSVRVRPKQEIIKSFQLRENDASTFLRTKRKITSLYHECCEETCDRHEMAECYGDTPATTQYHKKYEENKPEVCYELAHDGPPERDDEEDESTGTETGDPHITTFDGRRFDYQGVCTYILFTDGCGQKTPTFIVESITEPGVMKGRDISRVSAATVRLGTNGPVISLKKGDVVMVNGDNVHDFPYKLTSDVLLTRHGQDTTVVDVDGKFTLSWDGKTRIEVQLHSDLHGKVCGLLGDADGDPNNDLRLPSGKMTREVEEFGNSWQAPGRVC